MTFLGRFVLGAYSKLLNLYPHRFRDEFAIEMQTVFERSVMDATREGLLPLLLVCGREFVGMPLNILKEFWHEIQGEAAIVQVSSFVPWKPGSWGESVWAGLPHLLIAILFAATSALANTGLRAVVGIVLGLLILAGFLTTIYYTWRNRWPVWSASWYGYIALIVLLFSTLPYQYWEGLAGRIFIGLRFVILLMCLLTLLYWLSRRNPIEGLLMAMPVIILYWFPVMEFVPFPIRFWLILWLFLLPGLTAIAINRLNDIKKAVWLVLGASMLNGLPIAYARTYWNTIPREYSSPPTIGKMAELFSVPWLASGALVLGPLLGWGLWNLGRRFGKVGRASALLVIAGMIVNLFGHFSYWWWFSKESYLNAIQIFALYQPGAASSIFMVYAGLAAILVGAIGLAVLSWDQNNSLTIALILVPLALPLAARFPTYFGYTVNLAGMSLELARLSDIYQSLIFLIGAGWLALSGWMIPCLYDQPHPDGVT